MKINITKREYETLMNALQIAGTIYGVMSDMVDEKYSAKSDAIDDLEGSLLISAKDFGFDGMTDKFEDKLVINEDYLNLAIEDIHEYEEFSFWDTLPRKLAERDLCQKYGADKIDNMDRLDYLKLEYPIEDMYRKEFEKNELEKFVFQGDSKLKTIKDFGL